MAFTREQDITKDDIGDFEIRFFVPKVEIPEEEIVQSGILDVQLEMSDSSTEAASFDLLARLQDDAAGLTHLANLASLRDYIRTRLENEVLPL